MEDLFIQNNSMPILTQQGNFGFLYGNKAYCPSEESGGWAILIALNEFQKKTQRKYATTKEIRSVKNEIAREFEKFKISGWSYLETLMKNKLVEK